MNRFLRSCGLSGAGLAAVPMSTEFRILMTVLSKELEREPVDTGQRSD